MLKTFPSPLGVSYSQIGKFDIIGIYPVGFRPLSGYLISKFKVRVYKLRGLNKFPSPLGVSYFQMSAFLVLNLFLVKVSVPSRGILFPNRVKQRIKAMNPSFRPLSGYLISKYCPPDPAILLAFLTLLRGKSFSCIFFLYLTYTIASKCSIYAVRGKIIFFSNKLLHTPILTHISHVRIKI